MFKVDCQIINALAPYGPMADAVVGTYLNRGLCAEFLILQQRKNRQ